MKSMFCSLVTLVGTVILGSLAGCGSGGSAANSFGSAANSLMSSTDPTTKTATDPDASTNPVGLTCDHPAVVAPGVAGDTSQNNSQFVATGPMGTARASHTATLLPNGKVLLVGGGQLDVDDLLVSIASAEIFDPSTRTFTVVGAPCIAREFHTATLLQNGKVLITGGRGFAGYPTQLPPTATAELYDPDSGSFSATGPMAAARSGHTASLLADGRVLIVGGGKNGTPAAEVYDPDAGSFTVIPAAEEKQRFGHSAVVLRSGRVLIAGGQNSDEATSEVFATAEIYDPGSNSLTQIGSMSTPRVGHTATLLPNGGVLIAGGAYTAALHIGQLTEGTAPLRTAELFDPLTETFVALSPMAVGRLGHTATVRADGTVLLAGGFQKWVGGQPPSGYQSESSLEVFDPPTRLFTSVAQMPLGRFWHSATVLPDGTVLFAGGIGSDRALTSGEIYR